MALKYTIPGHESSGSSSLDDMADNRKTKSFTYKESSYKEAITEDTNKIKYGNFLRSLTAYERHKIFINNYFLNNPQAKSLLTRDESRDKRDIDVLKENHKFLWDEKASINSWGEQIAKKYYDKLFKEYCICDLSRYKEGLVGMRWRTQKEVKDGKGQFNCGEKNCKEEGNLKTWEMNFGYIEQEVKKNTLIKLRLCNSCSFKVNFKHKRKEVRKIKKKTSKCSRKSHPEICDKEIKEKEDTSSVLQTEDKDIWKGPSKAIEVEDLGEEFEEYLEDLFL